MNRWMTILCFCLAVFGCGPADDAGEESPQALKKIIACLPNPVMRTCCGSDGCCLKGGSWEQIGGTSMCCRSDSNGKECVNDPDLWPSRVAPPNTTGGVSTTGP